jgi:hypothetical protein
MGLSQKQLEANQQNAKKGGVKTKEGKEVVKYNALKHGLLAKEVIIQHGEGAENPDEFDELVEDLIMQFNPSGSIEEMLVEKIAIAYWRLRRVYRFEVGLLRSQLDYVADEYFQEEDWKGTKINRTDSEIDEELNNFKSILNEWHENLNTLKGLHKNQEKIESTFKFADVWTIFEIRNEDRYDEYIFDEEHEPAEIRRKLDEELGWSDEDIWDALIKEVENTIQFYADEILKLEKEKERNFLRIQVLRKLGNIPPGIELEHLLRYETAIERQFYKAMNQLERLQRIRSGEHVTPPVEADISLQISE